jgi:hypothetical protein
MIYIVDIDGTICHTENSDYQNSVPIQHRIEYMNKLFDNGDELHYYTARGSVSGKDHTAFTEQQLKDWGVKYTTVNTGKPHYDVWIDDKAINADTFFKESLT